MCCGYDYRKLVQLVFWVNIGLVSYLSTSSFGSSPIDGNWTLSSELLPESSFLHHIAFHQPHQANENFTYEEVDKLRGKYKLEDFLWTGSGDGPLSEPNDGGLAWEENGAYRIGGATTVVLVTKTMVLFKTVVTTVYPVELTPTVVAITPTLTVIPTPTDSPSLYSSPYFTSQIESDEVSVEPTPTIVINPTTTIYLPDVSSSVVPPNNQKTTSPSPEVMPTPAHDLQPDETTYTNRLYWVNTIIKANGSQVHGEFQKDMQNNLAQVYASAFKRHLLSSLGVLKPNQTSIEPAALRRRYKRDFRFKDSSQNELDFQWLLLRDTGMSVTQIKSLAATVMNVSVAIVNITSDDVQPHVSLDYVVTAEGSPVPATAAVQDLHLITKREMEKQIGYEIIKKAEPLITLPSTDRPFSEGAGTSPWLIVAITTICLLVLLTFALMYMVWKWKHNRLGDTTIRARPQSGIEGGVINPAFLGPPSPIERSVLHRERPSSSIIVKSESSVHKVQEKESEKHTSRSATRRIQEDRQIALAFELSKQLGDRKEKSSSSSLGSESKLSEENFEKQAQGSPTRLIQSRGSQEEEFKREQLKRKDKKARNKAQASTTELQPPDQPEMSMAKSESEKRRRRKTRVVDLKHPTYDDQGKRTEVKHAESETTQDDEQQPQMRPSSASRDKITYGHLDLTHDPLARSMSDEAKRLLQQSKARSIISDSSATTLSSSDQADRDFKKTKIIQLPQTIDEISDRWSQGAEEGETSLEEKDQEMSESVEQINSSSQSVVKPSTKDAQVQTPTRSKKHPTVKTKAKSQPKLSRASSSKFSTESLLSTGSEEIIEIREIESSGEANPLGKMRKRFHQFLDDAFNVMGKREGELDEGRSKSAKVSISHEIETEEQNRPWTSQTIHEESIERSRPKSATPSTVIPPKKRAWTAGTQRRCQSASSGKALALALETKEEQDVEDSEICDLTSTTIQSSAPGTQSSILIFPGYPVYPDIPLPNTQPGTSQQQVVQASSDSAAPLIEAIKLEIKRFDKEKQHKSFNI